MTRTAWNKIHDEFSHLPFRQAYYYRHKERVYAANKDWEKRNPEKAAAKQLRGYNKRKLTRKEDRVIWNNDNKEYLLLEYARRRAKTQKVPCTISIEDIFIPEYCPLTGLKLQRHEGKNQEDSASIDKVIPHLGYVPGNVRVISKKANRRKQDMLRADVVKLLDYIDGKI